MLSLSSRCLATHISERAFSCCRAPFWLLRGHRAAPGAVFAALLKPMMLGASTRNTLVCIPIALEALKDNLKIRREICDLFFLLVLPPSGSDHSVFYCRDGFMGTLMGRPFSLADLGWWQHFR